MNVLESKYAGGGDFRGRKVLGASQHNGETLGLFMGDLSGRDGLIKGLIGK